jgi:hypothetical protein
VIRGKSDSWVPGKLHLDAITPVIDYLLIPGVDKIKQDYVPFQAVLTAGLGGRKNLNSIR